MVLLVVLWIMMLISILISHLLFETKFHMQLARGASTEIQQFEALEAALLFGEKKLTQQLLTLSNIESNRYFSLPSESYAGYYISLNAVRLPQPFCLLPLKCKGYYYEITATLQPKSLFIANKVCLKSTVALPSSENCPKELIKRKVGRSAWCHLLYC